MDPRDLAVPQLIQGGELDVGPGAAHAPDSPLPTRNEDAVACLDVVEVLDVILAEGFQPCLQILDQAVQAVVAVADVESEWDIQRPELDVRQVGPTEHLPERLGAPIDTSDIDASKGLHHRPDDLHVLLRHRHPVSRRYSRNVLSVRSSAYRPTAVR